MNLSYRRNQELGVLVIVCALLILGFSLAHLSVSRELTLEVIHPALIVVGVFLVLHIAVRILAPSSDPILIPATAFLTAIGIIMIYRLKPELAGLQVLWIIIGGLALVLVLLVFRNYKELQNYKYISAFLGIFLLLSPIFFGKEIHGAKLWLSFGDISFQPSEIAKILLVIFFAAYLQEKGELLSTATKRIGGLSVPEIKHFGPLLFMWIISLIILIFEKDLGSSLLFFGLFLGILYIGTQRLSYVMVGTFLFFAGAFICYQIFTHVQARVDIWLNPWQDIAGTGYQIVQSLFAIASGGLSGVGLGMGHPTNIPAAHTDFVFSAVSEELGLFGGFGIILAYLLVMARGMKIALTTEDQFGKLLVAGLTLVFALQSAVIIGGVTKLIPLTGVTLPLISYGGSSVLANFILIGLMLAVSNQSAKEYKG